ncbi:MAG: WecB/TagA/CpsF family glycosyltransferase [Brockia lithotrophica]|nr:WecB/TagA/CpsF family glycosyltransferase [Brockia lithotrophica]
MEKLVNNLRRRYTELRIAYAYSPPYRELSAQEEEEVVRSIRESGAKILFVGLGCPKQERWMANHKGKIDAVMVGVGAAFDFHAGRVRQAPPWMQRIGLEWLFRLLMEPRRLWKRYVKHNPRFLALAALQLFGARRYDWE